MRASATGGSDLRRHLSMTTALAKQCTHHKQEFTPANVSNHYRIHGILTHVGTAGPSMLDAILYQGCETSPSERMM
jgi:hypothetical protein